MLPGIGQPPRIGAAIGGSLCLACSDTFWFSAVEAETYAASCFFLFLIVLLILKGVNLEGERRTRIAILIFYLSGLAFCIHPMCLLALPVLPVSWYLRDKSLSLKHMLIALAIGIGIVLVINRTIAIGTFELSFFLDRLLVNHLYFPFYSGACLFILMLVNLFRYVLKKFPRSISYTWCCVFLMLGFLPYLMLFIRSNQDPPIDEANPENLQLIKAYMNREGYPTRPLLYGPYFDAEVSGMKSQGAVYYKDSTGYKKAGYISEYEYEQGRETVLPRIYSNDADHISSYQQWTGLKPGEKPTFIHNILFMIRYQLGHMYFRYLMFNFSGRESDVQNSSFLLPWHSMKESNDPYPSRARNQYWMAPLIVGIAGILFQWRRDRKGFLSNATVFLTTGVFLVLYLNSTPNEPRERDYIYVGSYVAFAIWIGLGILFAFQYSPVKTWALLAISVALPALMFFQNFDDHDRSGRTFQIDNARNVLASCRPNALLFTGGDNDTFPLWYLQEVEGFRTDVRVMVLSYLNTDWYINQLRNKYYESEGFTLTLNRDSYRQYGPNDVLYIQDKFAKGINASRFLQLLDDKHIALRVPTENGDYYHALPSKRLIIPGVNNNFVELEASGRYLQKNALAIVDILVSNPDRPLYFNFTSMLQTGLSIEDYLVQEGQVFRFDSAAKVGENAVSLTVSYRNLIEQGRYENLLDEDIYFNHEDFELRTIHPLRQAFNSLAFALLREEKNELAGNVMTKALKYLYQPRFKPSAANLQASNILSHLGKKREAAQLAMALYTFNNYEIERGNSGEAEIQLRHFASEILDDLSNDR
jgi:hypothetical protein